MTIRFSSLLAAAILGLGLAHAADHRAGVQEDVVFTEYSALSASEEIARRNFSPLTIAELRKAADASGKRMPGQPLDLGRETFSLYVPDSPPPQGYSLLVLVSPLEEPLIPASWHWVLDRHGTIVVSAARSGNSQPIWDRRMPLALAGAYNVMQRYPVDPKKIFIGGWSGGSRVAMRLALDYPDLFHGALLNAGSDPIATPTSILPAAKLFEMFQGESKIIFVTGDMDGVNLGTDIASRQSMNSWCVFGTKTETMFHVGHEAPSAAYLDKALEFLQAPIDVDTNKLTSCRNRIAAELAAKLNSVREHLEHGKKQDALKELKSIDQRYGGLAAPDSVALWKSIDAQPQG